MCGEKCTPDQSISEYTFNTKTGELTVASTFILCFLGIIPRISLHISRVLPGYTPSPGIKVALS